MSTEIDTAFARCLEKHPDVWALFVQFAEELKRAGRSHYSADAILHRIRWHYDTTAHREGGTPRINNNMSSRFARKLMGERPEFAGFFRTRRLAGERVEVESDTYGEDPLGGSIT